MQDRLVKELRLQKISTPEEANAFLLTFIKAFNHKFAVVPKDPDNAHRELLSEHNLELIFIIKEHRTLLKNLTFQHNSTIYQVHTSREEYVLKNRKIDVYEKQDGSIEAFRKEKKLLLKTYAKQEKQGVEAGSKEVNALVNLLTRKTKKKYKPSKEHPWKRNYKQLQETAA